AMGAGLTLTQIIEPLHNVRLVVLSVLANFVLMPLSAFALANCARARRTAWSWTAGARLRGRRAIPAEARRTRQGQPPLCRWRDGATDGHHGWLPAYRPAPAAPRSHC